MNGLGLNQARDSSMNAATNQRQTALWAGFARTFAACRTALKKTELRHVIPF
jgi:hypothetical protein